MLRITTRKANVKGEAGEFPMGGAVEFVEGDRGVHYNIVTGLQQRTLAGSFSEMKHALHASQWAIVLLGCLAIPVGCGKSGPDLGQVTGKVTLNGKPLADASIEFIPEKGRPSMATTDAGGQYELVYTADRPGALPGKHTVRITTGRPGYEGEGGQGGQEARDEVVPPKYNSASELAREVKPGSNTIDFKLESEGGTFPLLTE